jgi:four helix bundle protein
MLVAQSITNDLIRSLRPVVAELRRQDGDLASQITRAATSVALNLAEGTRRTARDKRRVYRIAAAEAQEVKMALETIAAWGYLDDAVLAVPRALADRVGALTYGLAR